MSARIDALLVVVLLLNLLMLGTSRPRAIVTFSAIQGAILGAIGLLAHVHFEWRPTLVAIGAIVTKGILIPWMLFRALRDAGIRRELSPYIGYIPSLLAGAAGTGLAVIFGSTLPLAPQHVDTLLVPTSLSTVLTGFILLITRRKAITQVVGYLLLENGIFIMGLTLIRAMPFLVEVGVLLDLVVGIFVMGIIMNQIHREFASLDTTHLSQLKE